MSSWPTIDELASGMSASATATDTQALVKPFVHDDGQVKSLHFSMGGL